LSLYLILKQWFWTELEEVVSVYRSQPNKYSLHTTRSWDFIGLGEGEGNEKHSRTRGNLLAKAKYGEEVIVGLLDSGTNYFNSNFI
jgi:hypothetical protein